MRPGYCPFVYSSVKLDKQFFDRQENPNYLEQREAERHERARKLRLKELERLRKQSEAESEKIKEEEERIRKLLEEQSRIREEILNGETRLGKIREEAEERERKRKEDEAKFKQCIVQNPIINEHKDCAKNRISNSQLYFYMFFISLSLLFAVFVTKKF